MKCQGFLFELDGVLADSQPIIEQIWAEWGAARGIPVTDLLNVVAGKPMIAGLRHFMPAATDDSIRRVHLLLEKTLVDNFRLIEAAPGARALLARLNVLSIPWAIVTSGTASVVTVCHRSASLPVPDVFITAERTEKGKPAPDAFLLGAQLLGLTPESCTVVESTAAGIIAGLTSGCHVIAVNVPGGSPRLDKVAMRLTSLEELIIHQSETDGVDIYRRH